MLLSFQFRLVKKNLSMESKVHSFVNICILSFAREKFIVNPNVGWFVFLDDAFNVGKIKILPVKDMFPLQHRVFTVKMNGLFQKIFRVR